MRYRLTHWFFPDLVWTLNSQTKQKTVHADWSSHTLLSHYSAPMCLLTACRCLCCHQSAWSFGKSMWKWRWDHLLICPLPYMAMCTEVCFCICSFSHLNKLELDNACLFVGTRILPCYWLDLWRGRISHMCIEFNLGVNKGLKLQWLWMNQATSLC